MRKQENKEKKKERQRTQTLGHDQEAPKVKGKAHLGAGIAFHDLQGPGKKQVLSSIPPRKVQCK